MQITSESFVYLIFTIIGILTLKFYKHIKYINTPLYKILCIKVVIMTKNIAM